MNLRMFTMKIENYQDIILYFCEIGNRKEIFDYTAPSTSYKSRQIWFKSMDINLTNMTSVNEYKLDKYDPDQ